MDTFKWFIGEISGQFTYAAGSIFWNILLFGFLGFASGIALIVVGRKRGWFKREYRLWSFVAKLNYLYLPLLLMVFGGVTGSFYGAKKTADRFVVKVATPLAGYAQEYASNIQSYLPEPQWAIENDMTLDEMIAHGVKEKGGLKPGSFSHMAAVAINVTIVGHVLDELGMPELVRDPIGAVRALREATYQAAMFSGMTPKLQSVCGYSIWLKYKIVLFLFLPFLLLPVGEYLIHQIFKGLRGKGKQTGSLVQTTLLLGFACLFVACGKEDGIIEPVVPANESYISAKFNGNFEKSFEIDASFTKIGGVHISGDSISLITIIGRTELELGTPFSIILLQLILVTPPLAGEVYSKTAEKCDDLETVEECSIIGFTTTEDKYNDQVYSNAEHIIGNPQIKFDVLEFKIGGRLKGTFSGTIIGKETGEIMEVTEGEFDTFTE